LDNEKAKLIKGIIAEVVGFDLEDISDEDKFIVDYKITYGERKALLEKLNQTFQKEFGFDEFCKMDKVADVVDAYNVSSVGQSG
jgi:acyl carrier protein